MSALPLEWLERAQAELESRVRLGSAGAGREWERGAATSRGRLAGRSMWVEELDRTPEVGGAQPNRTAHGSRITARRMPKGRAV